MESPIEWPLYIRNKVGIHGHRRYCGSRKISRSYWGANSSTCCSIIIEMERTLSDFMGIRRHEQNVRTWWVRYHWEDPGDSYCATEIIKTGYFGEEGIPAVIGVFVGDEG